MCIYKYRIHKYMCINIKHTKYKYRFTIFIQNKELQNMSYGTYTYNKNNAFKCFRTISKLSNMPNVFCYCRCILHNKSLF